MNLKIEPIGIIKSSDSGLADILIYSDFEKVLGDMMIEKGTKMLIVHKNMGSSDHHQVNVSAAELVNRKGNLLVVKGINADNDSVIDVRLRS
ncbi:MAG: hypothetical protein OIN87_05310 [Candidatus Methanoperedens sp.]|nr:hypothetical protein [Candidatus Methanoperedens sp.]